MSRINLSATEVAKRLKAHTKEATLLEGKDEVKFTLLDIDPLPLSSLEETVTSQVFMAIGTKNGLSVETKGKEAHITLTGEALQGYYHLQALAIEEAQGRVAASR